MFRILLLAWAVSGLGFGSSARADEAEDKAAAFVKRQGGSVERDEKAPGKPVIGVNPNCATLTDAGLKELVEFKQLTTIRMWRAKKVTAAGLKEFASINNLNTLKLDEMEVTDAGLKELGRLKKLLTLSLRGSKVSAAGLKELAALKGLTTLDLSLTQVTDAGVKELQKALLKCKIIP